MGSGNIALGVVIGGAVGATFGKALSDSSSKIDAFKQKAEKVRGFQNLIGDTIRLRTEMEKTADKSGAAFGKLLKDHEANIAKLKSHGFAVQNLDKDYARLGRTVKGLELGAAGRLKVGDGIAAGKENWKAGAAMTAAIGGPTMVSANYQAVIRDIAIKGGFANTEQERQTSDGVRDSAARNGVSRDELAGAINQLVSGGMSAKEALSYADVIAKFSVGQGSSTEETAKMIRAISQNAQIKDAAGMNKALEAIAYLGQAGNFESPDMAKAFPGLLAEMQKLGIVGQDSVTQLGAMLQVQMKVTGSADEAANNLKNWFSKIGSEETAKNYKNAGIDYEGSMKTNIAKGYSTLEASLGIAKQYIEQIDPAKAQQLKVFAESMDKVSDPEKRKAQIKAFEEVTKTGDLFNDMQVKAALTAYMQNSELYSKLKKEAAESTGLLDKNLKERQEMSKSKWEKVGHAIDEAMARIGDAIRPATDMVADGLAQVGNAIGWVAKEAPGVAGAVLGIGAAFVTFRTVAAAWKIGSGMLDIGRGALAARGAGKLPGLTTVAGGKGGKGGAVGKVAEMLGAATGAQPVFVTNWPGSGFGGGQDLPGGVAGKPETKPPPGKPRGRFAVMKAGATGLLGKVAPYAGKIGGGMAVAGAAYSAVDTFRNAKTDQENAEGYGGAAGGLAGGLAGAKTGAVFGALAGPVGIAIGGIAGGVLGSILGDKAGSWLGGKMVDQTPQTKAATVPPAPTSPVDARGEEIKQAVMSPLAAAPSKQPTADKPAAAPQQLTFSPTIQVTVQGEMKDPRQLANELMPHLRRMFEQFQSQSTRGAMFDPAHT